MNSHTAALDVLQGLCEARKGFAHIETQILQALREPPEELTIDQQAKLAYIKANLACFRRHA
jgi:hypothetical protein